MKKVVSFFFRYIGVSAILFSIVHAGWDHVEARTSEGLEAATLVWVQKNQNGSALFYSQYADGRWNRAKQLTKAGGTNLLPALEMNGKSQTYIVWSSTRGSGFQLHYAIIENGNVVKGPAEILTGLHSNLGPSLAYDRKKNRMLLVWSGSSGTPDDIFLSEYDNGSWSVPSRIHPENEVSDYLPKIIVDPGGSIKVEWQATTLEGPREFSTIVYSGTVEKAAPGSQGRLRRQQKKLAVENCITRLPVGIDDLEDSSIVFKCKGNALPEQVKYLGSYMRKLTK